MSLTSIHSALPSFHRPPGRRRTSRRRVTALGSVLVLAVAFLAGSPGAVAAPDDNSLFELDGNVHDQAAAGDDWSNIFAGSDSAFTTTGIVADPAPLTIFTGGGSKDDLDVPGWRHKNGSVPDKDNITDAYAAAYTQANDTFVYFGLDRSAVQGSANVGFWFFQDDVAPVPGVPAGTTSTFSGRHQLGDLLVLSEFDGGGSNVTIKVLEWVGTGGDEGGGTLQTLFGGATGAPADCDATPTTANVCANVNTVALPDADIPWNYVGKGGTRNMPAASFFEGGINLDAFFGQAPCFTNVVAETRSSFEVNAVLKDLAHSRFDLCGGDISIAPDAVNDVGDSHTFTVSANTTVAGQQTPAPDGTVVTVTLTDGGGNPITPTADTCATGTTGGSCSVTFSSSVAGLITGHAEADIVTGGGTVHVETGGTGNNPDAVKRFVDARITIGADDVNGINEPHTFTVDVDQDLGGGAGFVAATVGHVTAALTDSGGAVNTVNGAASTCDDAGDNLDGNGQCTLTFTSAVPGTVTGHASVSLDLTTPQGTITITRSTDGVAPNSDDAVKQFVDGSLSWLKNDDTGARLGGASFRVCQTHRLDTSTTPDTLVAVPVANQVCVTVLDNTAPDTDTDAGEFTLVDLELGRYTVGEVAPFPPGYEPDASVKSADLTLEPGPRDVTIATPFVNRALYRLIVITCNTTTEELVDSTVTLGSDVRESVKPGQLGGLGENALCQLPGANYDNLTRGTYTPSVELPDAAPLFP